MECQIQNGNDLDPPSWPGPGPGLRHLWPWARYQVPVYEKVLKKQLELHMKCVHFVNVYFHCCIDFICLGFLVRCLLNKVGHLQYKEFRDVTINGAVSQLYSEMAGRHRANPGSIQIINAAVLKASQCRRDHVTEMHNNTMKFPVVRNCNRHDYEDEMLASTKEVCKHIS